MLLNQLFESVKANAAFAFGRFNPPHQGHVAVWNTVAKSGGEWFIGTNPGTSGPKDPLPYDVKTAWMTAIDPNVKGHIMPETSVLTLATTIYKHLGERQGLTIAYITDDQDWAWSGKLLNDYNGKEATHGYYNFAKIIHVPSPRVSSATALRDAARAGDMKAFYAAAGTDPDLKVSGKHYYDTVVDYLAQHPEKIKKPKKVVEPVAQEDAAGVGVIASKKQANDPRYSMSLTKDVRPGQVKKSLNAFKLEAMLPDRAFAGSDKNKLGPKAHLKGKMKRPARQGDLVGEENPNQQLSIYKSDGKTYKGKPMPTLTPDPVDDADEYNLKYDEPIDQDFDSPQLKKHLAKAMSGLPERYQEVVRLRFMEEMTLDEVARELGVTRERIRQMEAKALRYLRHPSQSDTLKTFLEPGVSEEKQKGVDGKACWKGYKRMGTKQKGGKTVDNCVKIGESYERKIASLIEQLKKK
jgi:RNA polymerase sigma factor (sigma-70 family)